MTQVALPAEDRVRPGHFIWHDLSTPDPDSAVEFYGTVLGWNARRFEGNGSPYWTWVSGWSGGNERGRGGLVALTDAAGGRGAVPGWTGYVWTPDADRDTERAWELGGKVVIAPLTVPSVGRMSVVRDPQGAAFTLMTPDTSGMPEAGSARDPGGPESGRFDWNELSAPDPDRALLFYAELFGWRVTGVHDMGEVGTYRIFGCDGVELGGMFARSLEDPGPAAWLYYVLVADLEGALRRLAEAGGEIVHGPSEVPGGRIAHCRDPQGALFGLHDESTG
jgi:predicted enzyme related to lactoylglutathione lyase